MIGSFSGEFSFLSNFFVSPIYYNGLMYPTVEHLYQARKTLNSDQRDEIRIAETPGQAKRLGRKVELRANWEEIKIPIMHECLLLKFSNENVSLQTKLLASGQHMLIEGNKWHDNFWGICNCDNCRRLSGKNNLGKLLMLIREEYRLSMEFWI